MFVCEKFMNEKFSTAKMSRDMISLSSIHTPMKGFKRIYRISINRGMISLNTEKRTKSTKQDNTICIEGKQIILKVSQTDDYYGIQKNWIYQYLYIMTKSPAIYQKLQTRITKILQKMLMRKLSA